MAWVDSQLETSVRCAAVSPPASAATSRARASSMSAIRTRAPSAAKPSVMPRPMLLAPPVTITALPARPRSILGRTRLDRGDQLLAAVGLLDGYRMEERVDLDPEHRDDPDVIEIEHQQEEQ